MDDWRVRATQFLTLPPDKRPVAFLAGRFHLEGMILAFPLPYTSLYGPGFNRLRAYLGSVTASEKPAEEAYREFWKDKKDAPVGQGRTREEALANLKLRCEEFLKMQPPTFQEI